MVLCFQCIKFLQFGLQQQLLFAQYKILALQRIARFYTGTNLDGVMRQRCNPHQRRHCPCDVFTQWLEVGAVQITENHEAGEGGQDKTSQTQSRAPREVATVRVDRVQMNLIAELVVRK